MNIAEQIRLKLQLKENSEVEFKSAKVHIKSV